MEYRFEADGESFCDPHNPNRTPGSFGERSVIEFPGYAPPRLARSARPAAAGRARTRARGSGHRPTPTRAARSRCSPSTTAATTSASPSCRG